MYSVMHYVYLLQSVKSGKIYTGQTSDLRRRIFEHKSGNTITTAKMLPVRLVFYEAFLDKHDAVRREMYLKTSKGKSTVRMMLQSSLNLK